MAFTVYIYLQEVLRARVDAVVKCRFGSPSQLAEYRRLRVLLHDEWLSQHGLEREVKPGPPDGDCMFSALGRLMYSDPHVLRAGIIGYARCHSQIPIAGI